MKHDTKSELQARWNEYFTAMRAGDVPKMKEVYTHIEALQASDKHRRTTQRMLAVAQVDAAYAKTHAGR